MYEAIKETKETLYLEANQPDPFSDLVRRQRHIFEFYYCSKVHLENLKHMAIQQ